jgi:hypothetical protein
MVCRALLRTCWVWAPRAERLPPHTLRVTTAGRRACSARQFVASIVVGGMDPEPHSDFIEVLCNAAFRYRDGEVERAGEDGKNVGRGLKYAFNAHTRTLGVAAWISALACVVQDFQPINIA